MFFEKVSLEEFTKAVIKCNGEKFDVNQIEQMYENIKLPHRSTERSAGYDFYAPYEIAANASYTLVPTGIRWVVEPNEPNCVLCLFPRSGLGFKYGVALRNTVGIIDQDYCSAENEGHIMAKINAENEITIAQGSGFMQGIILPFLTVDDDNATGHRTGGFGSTDSKN